MISYRLWKFFFDQRLQCDSRATPSVFTAWGFTAWGRRLKEEKVPDCTSYRHLPPIDQKLHCVLKAQPRFGAKLIFFLLCLEIAAFISDVKLVIFFTSVRLIVAVVLITENSPEGHILAGYYGFDENISFPFRAIKSLCSSHFGDFWVHLGINCVSKRISEIYGNRKFWRFDAVYKLEFELRNWKTYTKQLPVQPGMPFRTRSTV